MMSFSAATLLDLLRSGYNHNERAIKRELHKGANPNIVHPDYGVSAMHLASGQGEEPTQILLWHGGDPNVVSLDGLTPLHVAASWGDWNTLQLLLKNGADSSIQDQDGLTAYDLAVEEGNNDCAQLLKYSTVTEERTSRHFDVKRNTAVTGKTCLNCVHAENNHMTCHTDTSANEFEVSSQTHLDTITGRIYKYLDEGKKVCFNVTSPDTPVLEIKTRAVCAHGQHCLHNEDNGSHSNHRLQNGDLSILSLSPESPICYKNSCRRCMDSNHDYFSCRNAVPNNIGSRDTSVTDRRTLQYHKQCNVFESESSDQLHCTCISPQAIRNIHYKPSNNASPYVFCRNYRIPLCTESCNDMIHNATCVSPTHNCNSLFVSSSLNGFKSSSSMCRKKAPVASLPVSSREHALFLTDMHSPEIIYNHNTPTIKSKDRSINDLEEKHSVLHDYKSPYIYKDFKNQMNSPHLNKCGLTLGKLDVQESLNTGSCSSNRVVQSAFEKQRIKDQPPFCSELSETLSVHSTASIVGDNFNALTSELQESLSMVLQDKTTASTENIIGNILKSDEVSGVKFNAGKLFPPMQVGCGETMCAGGITSVGGITSAGSDFPTDNKKGTKKLKRRSLLKPPETVALLPKSQMLPHERVAEFILSVQKFMDKSNVEDFINSDDLIDKHSPHFISSKENARATDWWEQNSLCDTEQTVVKNYSILEEKTCVSLNSSTDTFATCDEGYSDAMTHENDLRDTEKELKNRIISGVSSEKKIITEGSSSRWKAPTLVLPDDDIMTSDDSYIRKTHHKVYKMKLKPKLIGHCEIGKPKEKQNHVVSTNLLSNDKALKLDNPILIFPVKKRMSSESLFTVSNQEYVYKDKETNITFIERHIPSDCGSNSIRRSLDSTVSRETIDSQATVIYDWRVLNEVLKVEKPKTQPLSLSQPHNNHCENAISNSDIACNESSPKDMQHSNESIKDEVDEPAIEIVIPKHLQKMTCQEISQELQKYGEIPGPVIPATRQTYLRRLTTLKSNPGLVMLSKTCSDYPYEMRQALNGQFDASGLPELESKMIEVFSESKNGSQWREGTVKSSFTYLLLDPRITDNLPLRAKTMSDLEVFKTFICSIFYIGKGKRSRPYCHLYDAVSKMNKAAKMSAKEKQILDIWKAGFGVVSLHCFQSVIPVEAYTREACMIQAIGMHRLTNMKQGDLYGAASSWTAVQRRKLGVYLLKKALQIFLAEGERQICLPDLKGS